MPYASLVAALFIAFLLPYPAQSSYCSDRANECIKKCEEERIKSEREINTHSGKLIDKKLQDEILSKIHKLDIHLHECRKECSTAYKKCNSEHPTSTLEERVEWLEREVNVLKEVLDQHKYLLDKKKGQ